MSKYLELRKININEHTEKKGKFTYLSWAWAVDQLLQLDSLATWTYDQPMAFGDTLMVFCTVEAFGKKMTAQLPVMNNQNKSMPNPDSFAVNTAMQRCLAKAIALHGLGLYIYAGEDLPSDSIDEETPDLTDLCTNWCDMINECLDIDTLKGAYGQAYKELSKDKVAIDRISKAKDKRKGELL
jgi:hypothetical protein